MSKKEFSSRPFEKLRKTIEQQTAFLANRPERRKGKDEWTEDEFFNKEMDGVHILEEYRELSFGNSSTAKDRVPEPRRDPDREAVTILDEIASGSRPMHLPDTQEYVEWTNPDYYSAIIQKLHEGQFSVQASLDLHGCTVAEAEAELDEFLQDAGRKGFACVKVIHGRGLRSLKGPRIKEAVLRRLAGHYRTEVIAYVTARQCDGGLGALYILLKK